MISLNYRDSRPIYEQIKDGLKKLIVTGGLAADERLPSVRALATQLSINPNTIQRAYNELEGEGYIYSIPGKGSFAAANAGADENRKRELLNKVREILAELRYLGVSRQEVLRAEAQIRALDPRPGAAFAPREEPVYLVPDLVVLQGERGLEVHLQESRLPGLRLSRFYCDMYRDDPDPEVRQYLDGKIRQAQWAIQAVEQRRATLLRCAQVLVRRQEAFFQSPGGSLTSLRLADVAAELSIHESTVSRAVREKYLQCARGVYPLSFFFPREVGAGEGQSAHEIKNQLLQLIREEDKSRPCSDQKLCQLLAEAGYAVSRRTVAKYREELGVSSAVGRRA